MEQDPDMGRGTGPSLHVLIFPTKAEMYAWYEAWARRRDGIDHVVEQPYDFEGITSTWEHLRVGPDGAETRLDEMGQILLHQAAVGAGVVAHECTHAALAWARRVGLSIAPSLDGPQDAPEADERLCWVLGWLVSQFWTEYFRRCPAEDPEPERTGLAYA